MKYYIEIVDRASGDYIFQSIWFDTEQEAEAWVKTVAFFRSDFECWLMRGEWDEINNNYIDINIARRLW